MAVKTEEKTGFVSRCDRENCGWVSNLCVTSEDADASGLDHDNEHNREDQAAAEPAQEASP